LTARASVPDGDSFEYRGDARKDPAVVMPRWLDGSLPPCRQSGVILLADCRHRLDMPPFRCGWPTSSRGIQVRSSRTVPAAPYRSITCLAGSGVVGRQLDGAAIGPETKHSLERVAAEPLWSARRESSPQQAERPRDAGLLYPMTRPAPSTLTGMKSGPNGPGRGRPPGPRSRLAAGAEPAEQQIIDRYQVTCTVGGLDAHAVLE
jgi:hypothetical protein